MKCGCVIFAPIYNAEIAEIEFELLLVGFI